MVLAAMSSEYLHVAKNLARGALLGLSASIKPGGLHRLAPGRNYSEVLCNIVSSIDFIVEALEQGDRIRRGEQALTSIDLGRLLSSTIRESLRFCTGVHPQYTLPLVVGSLSIGLSGVESILEESSKFKKALDLVNSISKWSSIKQVIDSLKIAGREDMYEHLSNLGYTQLALVQAGVNFNDIYRALGSRWRSFLLIESREALVFTYLKKLSELYRKYESLENSSVALYMELIRQHLAPDLASKAQKAEECGYMSTPECSKLMLELDIALRRSGRSFEWASEVVTVAAAFASFEGLK